MSCHVATMTLFVPRRSLNAGFIEVPRQATVVAMLTGTLTGQVTQVATKDAGRQLLHGTNTHQSEQFDEILLNSKNKVYSMCYGALTLGSGQFLERCPNLLQFLHWTLLLV